MTPADCAAWLRDYAETRPRECEMLRGCADALDATLAEVARLRGEREVAVGRFW